MNVCRSGPGNRVNSSGRYVEVLRKWDPSGGASNAAL